MWKNRLGFGDIRLLENLHFYNSKHRWKQKIYKGNFNSALTDFLIFSNERSKRGLGLDLLNPDMYNEDFMEIIFYLDKFILLILDNLGTSKIWLNATFSALVFWILLFPLSPKPLFWLLILNRESLLHYKDCCHHLFYIRLKVNFWKWWTTFLYVFTCALWYFWIIPVIKTYYM